MKSNCVDAVDTIEFQRGGSVMSNPTKTIVEVKDTAITILSKMDKDYISLTDIARFKDSERSDYIIQNWLRTRNTIEFLGIWQRLNNLGFNSIEFDGIRNQAGLNDLPQGDRLKRLDQIAIRQMQILSANTTVRKIGAPKEGKE